ncbi:hypothetical protein TSUD_336760 [Trifolium subterraneum]|uniref:Uncharacterized protein n=1 Tax=Trifolium subterraneum TaxID=3900 RepID=A0A2Z6LXI3_TRISU|nr:hypothetical protein TSUD_336760 [Trifolium subterraneum]
MHEDICHAAEEKRVIMIVSHPSADIGGWKLDENAMEMFRSKCDETVKYIGKGNDNVVEEVIALGESADYDLIVIGKGRFPSTMVAGTSRVGSRAYRVRSHRRHSSNILNRSQDEDAPMYKVKVDDENVAEVPSDRHEIRSL